MNKYMKIFRITIIALAFLIVIFLLAKDFALCGKLEFSTNFKKFTPFISILVPEERTAMFQNIYINEEPVYFDVFMPRDFDIINLEFTFQNQFNSLIQLGAQVGEEGWDLKPLESQIIDNLIWPSVEENGLVLFQRDYKYNSVKEFLDNLPKPEEIASFNYNIDHNFTIKDYLPVDKITILENDIDDGYEFYTYIKDEDMYYQFELDAGDFDVDKEFVYLNVYDKDNNLISNFYPEKNVIDAELQDLVEGVYKLELISYESLITKKIKTKQQYMSFINELNIVDDQANLITNSKSLSFLTFYNEGVQTVEVDNEKIEINEIWEQKKINLAPGIKEIKIPKGKLSVIGDGLFAFNKNQYFNPLIKKINQTTDLEKEGINYIIANYNLPKIEGGFKMNSVEYDLADKGLKDGKLRFVISIPGLVQSGQGIVIKDLRVELVRDSIFADGLITNIKNYLRYYKNEIK
jgi:hypothetical protein